MQTINQKSFQNDGQTTNKSTSKTRALSSLIFSRLGLNFGPSWASKSAALLAAPGVLEPTAFYACINILLCMLKGGARSSEIRVQTSGMLGQVGTMLAYFSVLGVFVSLWNASRTFVGRFFTHGRLFFRVLGGSGSDVWASRDNFEGPKLLFLVFCRPRRSAMRKNCACAKTTVFPVFLYGFYILRALSSSHKTTQNHSRGLFNRASCKDCAPIPS